MAHATAPGAAFTPQVPSPAPNNFAYAAAAVLAGVDMQPEDAPMQQAPVPEMQRDPRTTVYMEMPTTMQQEVQVFQTMPNTSQAVPEGAMVAAMPLQTAVPQQMAVPQPMPQQMAVPFVQAVQQQVALLAAPQTAYAAAVEVPQVTYATPLHGSMPMMCTAVPCSFAQQAVPLSMAVPQQASYSAPMFSFVPQALPEVLPSHSAQVQAGVPLGVVAATTPAESTPAPTTQAPAKDSKKGHVSIKRSNKGNICC
jgi:hypothetical protein